MTSEQNEEKGSIYFSSNFILNSHRKGGCLVTDSTTILSKMIQEEAISKATVVHSHSTNPRLLKILLWVSFAMLYSLTNKYLGQNKAALAWYNKT